MSVELLLVMARSFYIVAGILVCVESILFFYFKIWKIVGDLSGINEKRAIKAICEQSQTVKNYSQNFFIGKEREEIKTELLECMEETGYLEPKEGNSSFSLDKKLE